MKLVREVLVFKDQIDEDFIGEEDWSDISTDFRLEVKSYFMFQKGYKFQILNDLYIYVYLE